ncbi:hypothetical protein [Micromonospora sp. NPDC005652]|uniref:hypothetical protein n=1 Tax=Micromonospora sp. NPDC005652 TaxID=3157046 RepID=UPI00340C387D
MRANRPGAPGAPEAIRRVALIVQTGGDIAVIETGDGAGRTEVEFEYAQEDPEVGDLGGPRWLVSTPSATLRLAAETRFGRGSTPEGWRYRMWHWVGDWPDLGDPRCGARHGSPDGVRCERWRGHVESDLPEHVAGALAWRGPAVTEVASSPPVP